MRIEFVYWPGNTEVRLIEYLPGAGEHERDSFYTSQTHIPLNPSCDESLIPRWDSSLYFEALEDVLKPPVIPGPFGHLHPYWYEREERRKHRAVQSFQSNSQEP